MAGRRISLPLRLPGHPRLQPRHDSAAVSRGFSRLSAWPVDRLSRQLRRKRGRREPPPLLIPPPHPPARPRNPRRSCASRRGPPAGRQLAANRGGVGKGTRKQPSLAGFRSSSPIAHRSPEQLRRLATSQLDRRLQCGRASDGRASMGRSVAFRRRRAAAIIRSGTGWDLRTCSL